VSKHYSFIDTKEVITSLENKGLEFFTASFANPRLEKHKGYQKHMIVFKTGYRIDENNEILLLLTNSYNGSTSLKFNIGIYRMICANGLIAGNDMFFYRIRHRAISMQQIEEMIEMLHCRIPIFAENNKTLMQTPIIFNSCKALGYVKQCVEQAYGEHRDYLLNDIQPKHREDAEQNIYNLLNITQEHIMNGWIHYEHERENKEPIIKKVRAIKNIDRVINVNQNIYDSAIRLAA
jgi:hypothetical protein